MLSYTCQGNFFTFNYLRSPSMQPLAIIVHRNSKVKVKPMIEAIKNYEQKFTVKQVADKNLLGNISPVTVWREIKRGRLSCYRIGGKIFVGASHINDYLKKCEMRVA